MIEEEQKIEKALTDLVRISVNSGYLHGKNIKHARSWIFKENPNFYGISPANMCFAGKGEEVWKFQEELIGTNKNEKND